VKAGRKKKEKKEKTFTLHRPVTGGKKGKGSPRRLKGSQKKEKGEGRGGHFLPTVN